MKKLLLLCSILIMPLFAEKYECRELYGDYRVVYRGTKDEAREVSRKHYSSERSCEIDLDNYLNGRKTKVEYECIELYGDYRIVNKGTKDEAHNISRSRYSSRQSCNKDLDNYLNGRKTAKEYECIELYGDYRIVNKGTKDEARNISRSRYSSRQSCNKDLDNYLNGRKTAKEYECIELYGDYRIVNKGTKDEARNISRSRYSSRQSCNNDLDNYLNGRKSAKEYECIELYGDYRIVNKGTKDEARQVSRSRFTSKSYCDEALEDYLSRRR